MIEIDIDTDDVMELYNRYQKVRGIFSRELNRGIRLSMDVFKGHVTAVTPVDTGVLRSSIGFSVSGSGLSYKGDLSTPIVYGEPVEFGHKAGNTQVAGQFMFKKGFESARGSVLNYWSTVPSRVIKQI